jgi:hypothetical protein
MAMVREIFGKQVVQGKGPSVPGFTAGTPVEGNA